MSVIWGFATIATLIVLADVLPIAVAASDATARSPATKTPTSTFTERRELPFRASSMVDASSRADVGGARRQMQNGRARVRWQKITLSRGSCQEHFHGYTIRRTLTRKGEI